VVGRRGKVYGDYSIGELHFDKNDILTAINNNAAANSIAGIVMSCSVAASAAASEGQMRIEKNLSSLQAPQVSRSYVSSNL